MKKTILFRSFFIGICLTAQPVRPDDRKEKITQLIMKNLKVNLFALLSLVMFSTQSYAQENGFIANIDYGVSKPFAKLAENNDLSGLGGHFNAGLAYYWGSIGLSFQGGYTANGINETINGYSDQVNTLTTFLNEEDKWKSLYTTLGPAFRLGSGKIGLNLSPKLGLLKLNSPAYQVVSQGLGSDEVLFVQGSMEFDWQLILAGEIGVNYQISEIVGVNLRAEYISNKAFTPQEISYAVRALQDSNGEPGLQLQDIQNAPLTQETFEQEMQTINLSVGVTFRFGGNKKTPKGPVDLY